MLGIEVTIISEAHFPNAMYYTSNLLKKFCPFLDPNLHWILPRLQISFGNLLPIIHTKCFWFPKQTATSLGTV